MSSGWNITASADWAIPGFRRRGWARNMEKEGIHERPIESEWAWRREWESEVDTPGEPEPQFSTPETQGLENEFASASGNFSQNLGIAPKHTKEGAATPAFPVQLGNEFDTPG